MLDLGQPALDKNRLVGACARLPLTVDAARLQADVAALPAAAWESSGGRVGVHYAAAAIFLRGYAPAEGDKPIADRPALAELPYLRALIHEELPAAPQRCLLARLPAGGIIAPHIDRAPYFAQTLRLHLPVTTSAQALMYCAGSVYRMAAGEVWALNNIAVHGVWNADPTQARTHLICDYLPSSRLLALLADADRTLGVADAGFEQRVADRLRAHQGPAVSAA